MVGGVEGNRHALMDVPQGVHLADPRRASVLGLQRTLGRQWQPQHREAGLLTKGCNLHDNSDKQEFKHHVVTSPCMQTGTSNPHQVGCVRERHKGKLDTAHPPSEMNSAKGLMVSLAPMYVGQEQENTMSRPLACRACPMVR